MSISLFGTALENDKIISGNHNIIFGGCGGLAHYFIGGATVLEKHIDRSKFIFNGISAGCFPALLLAAHLDIEETYKKFNELCKFYSNKYWIKTFFNWGFVIRSVLTDILPDNIHQILHGKYRIIITDITDGIHKQWVVDSWESRDDLIECILASCHIWIYDGGISQILFKDTQFRSRTCIDGAFSTNYELLDKTSKLFKIDRWQNFGYFDCLITLNDELNMSMFKLGKQDFIRHLDVHDLRINYEK